MGSDGDYRFFRIRDLLILLILGILFLAGADHGEAGQSHELVVQIHCGDTTLVQPLDADTNFIVQGNLGAMEIQVGPSGARIARSPCPGQDCVRSGWLSREGDLSICVPSGVFLVVTGSGGTEVTPDAVSY